MSLSPNDVDKIRQLMQRVAKLETQSGSATRNIQRAPAHYLVVAPVGGIPAFVDPVPGQATCLMTRRFSDHPPDQKELAEMSTKQVVYNLGEEIPGGEIVIAHRDAFGDLFIPDTQQANSLFPLTFAQTGGEDVCPAEWTYTVTHSITDEELGTEIDPTASPHRHTRPQRSLIPATAGLGYYDAEGTFIILRAYEELAGGCECDCPSLEGDLCTECEDEAPTNCCRHVRMTLTGPNGTCTVYADILDMSLLGCVDGKMTLVWDHCQDDADGPAVSPCGVSVGGTGYWEAEVPLVQYGDPSLGYCCPKLGIVPDADVTCVADENVDCVPTIVFEVIAGPIPDGESSCDELTYCEDFPNDCD